MRFVVLKEKNLTCELGSPIRRWLATQIKNEEVLEAVVLLLHRVFRYIRFVILSERNPDDSKAMEIMLHKELDLINEATVKLSSTIS